jgi:hypothetical protein
MLSVATQLLLQSLFLLALNISDRMHSTDAPVSPSTVKLQAHLRDGLPLGRIQTQRFIGVCKPNPRGLGRNSQPFNIIGRCCTDKPIIITLVSAATAALINGVINIITKIIDKHNAKAERQEAKISKFYEENKIAYIGALNKLLFIKIGLFIAKEDLHNALSLQEQIT